MVQPLQSPKPKTDRAAGRVKSEHRYPVYDLNDSIAVARAIRDQGGGAADLHHIASYLSYKNITSGAFITRIAAARRFGLVESRGGELVPTTRAMEILAPERPDQDDVAGRRDAFLAVPLYRTLYQRYGDVGLPPEVGLRNALETSYGVPRAQTQAAVRVFLDSAEQAGFFEARGGARTHLVAPTVGVRPPMPADDEEEELDGRRLPPAPPSDQTATEQLRRVLVEKIREIPATELDTIREYIKIIRELGGEEEEGK